MLTRFQLTAIRGLWGASALALLTACGGGSTGFPPVVTAFKAQTVQYSRPAVIYFGGNDLRSNMTVDTGGACSNPSFASSSSTSLLVLNCTVTQVGDMPLVPASSDGEGPLEGGEFTRVTEPRSSADLLRRPVRRAG